MNKILARSMVATNGTSSQAWKDLLWSTLNMSEGAWDALLRHGPDRFALHVKSEDEAWAIVFWNAWREISEEEVDLFLDLQREYAPVTPLYDRPVAARS